MGDTPWHIWVVGIVAVLWNAFGGYDYIMTQSENMDYLAGFTDEQIAYYTNMPLWANAVWAIAIWSAVAASVLILLRSKWAALLFTVSFVTMLISFVWGYFISDAPESTTTQMAMTGVIVVAALFFMFYSRSMARVGVLK